MKHSGIELSLPATRIFCARCAGVHPLDRLTEMPIQRASLVLIEPQHLHAFLAAEQPDLDAAAFVSGIDSINHGCLRSVSDTVEYVRPIPGALIVSR